MGIKRCPYCRALISEEDQYCRNCGTQLLFPEDENIEEEIPGEKILEEPEEETSTHNGEIYLDEEAEEAQEEEVEESEKITGEWEELDEEESGLSSEAEEEEVIVVEEENLKPSPPEDERDDFLKEKKVSQQKTPAELLFADDKTPLLFPEEELAEAEKTKPEETEGKEIKDEEYSLTEKIEELEKEAFSEIEEEEPGSEAGAKPGFVTMAVESLKSEIEREVKTEVEEETIPPVAPGMVTKIIRELEKQAGDSAEEKTEEKIKVQEVGKTIPTFSTEELDNIGPTVDLAQQQVEKFFEILEHKEKEARGGNMPEEEGSISEETAEVPGWVKEVKSEPAEELNLEESLEVTEPMAREETSSEETWEEERPSHPTIGFPESLTRDSAELEALNLETAEELEKTEELAEEEELEVAAGKDESSRIEVSVSGPSSYQVGEKESLVSALGFKNYVKAKVFDLLFVGLFWLLSIWLAARSMNSNLFRLLEVATSGLLLYLLILTTTYFFLFYFFIGETLGDRLFKEEEEKEEEESHY